MSFNGVALTATGSSNTTNYVNILCELASLADGRWMTLSLATTEQFPRLRISNIPHCPGRGCKIKTIQHLLWLDCVRVSRAATCSLEAYYTRKLVVISPDI